MPPRQDCCPSIVLLTENDQETTSLVKALIEENYRVRVQTRKQFKGAAVKDLDLLVVDSSKFSLEELSVYPRIRAVYSGLLMLLIDDLDEMLQVLLYEQGVDDLLIKPANHLLMLARIRALLRRNHQRATTASLRFDGLEINGGLRRASYQGRELPLTSREFDLLWHLAQNACTTLDRDHLYRAVFGIEYNGYDRSIDMYVARIRSKMAPYPNLAQMIKTVRGNGYLFAAQ